MIGNDVIDLALAKKESNWQRKGFLNKLFSVSEQSLLWSAEDPEKMVWILWSCKEAVYKIYNRETNVRAFIPLKINCLDYTFDGNYWYGKVHCNQKEYYTKTIVDAEFIETIAVTKWEDFESVKHHSPSKKFHKIDGIPYQYDVSGSLVPVSLSHHGAITRLVSL